MLYPLSMPREVAKMTVSWDLLADVAKRSHRYLEDIRERRVFPADDALAGLANLDVRLQEAPLPAEAVLAELDQWGSPATTASAGGRYFGFVNGGALPAALAANWLASAWDQNGAFREMSPASHFIEKVASRWVLELVGLPSESA